MPRLEKFPDNPYNAYCWMIGEPEIGEGCWVGAFTLLDGSGGLRVGKGCDISSGVQLVTHSSARRTVTEREYPHVDRAPIEIGDHVFLGTNAVVLMGSSIGHHSIVAAGAVVPEFSSFPPYSMIAGVPARRKGDVRWRPSNGEADATTDGPHDDASADSNPSVRVSEGEDGAK
jgi:acetyltransferase-like isoleucine patch superfamily enzyme